jgi:hypothetical protein
MTVSWVTVEVMAFGVVYGGLQCGDCGGAAGCWCFALHHSLEQLVDGAFAFFGFADFGAWGQDA